MADSRSSLQAPAELSDSGRFSPSPSNLIPGSASDAEMPFVCRVCAGTEYRVERLDAWRAPRLYEHLWCGGDPPIRALICTRCDAAVHHAHCEVREAILSQLLFAARSLAEDQFCRQTRWGKRDLICVECRTAQVADSYMRHSRACRTGRVLRLLAALMEIGNPDVRENAFRTPRTDVGSFPVAAASAEGGVR